MGILVVLYGDLWFNNYYYNLCKYGRTDLYPGLASCAGSGRAVFDTDFVSWCFLGTFKITTPMISNFIAGLGMLLMYMYPCICMPLVPFIIAFPAPIIPPIMLDPCRPFMHYCRH